MIPIISLFLGFLSSSIPSFFKYLETRQQLKYNVQLATLQLEATIRNIEAVEEIEKIKKNLDDTISARNADLDSGGGAFAEFLRASVRPIITYSLFGLFLAVKIISIFVLMNAGLTLENMELATKIILDEVTLSMIATIGGFWFGSRVVFGKK